VTPAEARAIQQGLRDTVIRQDCFTRVDTVAGVDVGFTDRGATTRAAVAVLAYPGLELLESAVALRATDFPYVPGLLSFREVPAVLEALQRLGARPDVLLCDAQGIAHPRRFGVACHLGVLTALPTIGVAKSRLIGTHGPVPEQRGGYVPLMDQGEQIGVVLRTRAGVRPVFVSVGHCVSLATAIALVMACTTRYRLPETTRWADRIASGRSPPR
jgi:deoxyribonuclease V